MFAYSVCFTRRFLVLACMVMGVCVVGCSQKAGDQKDANSPSSTENGAQSPGNRVAIEINDTQISHDEVDAVAAPYLARVDALASRLTPDMIKQQKHDILDKVISKIIIEHLLDEQVKKQGIIITEQEIDEKIAVMASGLEPPLTVEAYLKQVQASGMTIDAVREEARRGAGFDKLGDLEFGTASRVTEADARKYYDDTPEQFEIPERGHVAHILITPADSNDPNQAKVDARIKADALLQQIKAGADFSQLARTESDCSSKAQGGDLGYVKRGMTMVAGFENTVFALQDGQVSDVVETSYGFHIIKAFEHKEAGTFSFAEAKDQIIKDLDQEKRIELMREYINTLQQTAKIAKYYKE